ncbi:MAG TPA: amidohydrolase family protein, partial [Cyclobacteriaceae bacterium]|nr:amidohydrolase family protein [Cyclobacteriaceae bacterium]
MIRTIAIITLATLFSACQKEKYQIIIKGANIVDGTGSPAYVADVGINADTIAFVGDLSKAEGEKVIDAKGQVLSPGFIDTHSHHDRGMFENREMEALTSQGVTTMIIGQDGGSQFPLKDLFSKLERTPIALNVGSYTGHNRIRRDVLGEQYDRIATPEEVEKMKSLLKEDLENGSLGLSTGLEYDPGIYSDPSEVIELAKVLSPYQARYISHIRSEDRNFWSALNEIIAIGGQTGVPVQLSHAKLAMKSLWGQADKMIAKMDSARSAGIQL